MKGKRLIKRVVFYVGILGILIGAGCGMKASENSKEIQNYHNEQFGENVYFFSPEDNPEEVNKILSDIYEQQEENQFGKERYAVYFMPGEYDESIQVDVGFYTQVAGLGELPTDTKIAGLNCSAQWLGDDPGNHNACCNFWRGVENIEIGSNTMWAVSQATFMRRVQVDGALYLHDNYGWCSGGFLADSNIELMTDSGSQQQWLSRNCNWKKWMGQNWNMVFVGTEPGKNPTGTWPAIPYTTVAETERMQEKPFLIYDETEGYQIFVPDIRENATGVSWKEENAGRKIDLEDFYVAKPKEDTAASLNEALAKGKHLLLTPGIYELEESLKINQKDTIVLGIGYATLLPINGNSCLEVGDVTGVTLAGILFDAGEKKSDNLLIVGTEQGVQESGETIFLSDLFFRVGGTETKLPTSVDCCVTIHSDNVVGDNFWVWRADHGAQVAWDKNVAKNGIIVNGDDVRLYGLMVEHFEEYQTIWNGENGRVYMYQSEIPYDVPSGQQWMSHEGTVEGYASFYVAEDVKNFEAFGLGIYLYNRDNPVTLHTAMEVPDCKGVKVHHICTVMLNGYPGMEHLINDCGKEVMHTSAREIICEYEAGIVK